MNTEQPGIPEWLAKDNAEAERCADWLIRIVNADHQDKIEFNRDIGCRIRDHIERLRKDVAEQKRKYFEIERAHSRAVDKISDLTERVQLREKDLAERGAQKAKAESDLAEAHENASQNAGNYLACEKRFEEAIAQRDAANLRVEGLEEELHPRPQRREQAVKVVEAGHIYALSQLDGSAEEILTFVKREGPGYPGNVGSHAGTNMQEVIRCLIDRTKYLEAQIHDKGNRDVIEGLRDALFALETRAAERHGRALPLFGDDLELRATCEVCGHIGCESDCRARAQAKPAAEEEKA